jgi:hypothetical protein
LEYLENRLAQWRPRRPGPQLKTRLFGEQEKPAFAMADLWRLLVPVLGCSMLVLASLSPRVPQNRVVDVQRGGLLYAQSNAYAEPFMAAVADHSGQNNVPATKVEWNFGAQTTATALHFVQFYTNKLIQ